jgi:hypothetical protein
MNRKPTSKSHASAAAVLSAGVLMASGSATPPATPTQGTSRAAAPGIKGGNERMASIYIKFASTFQKWRGSLTVAGMMNGRPMFKTPQGEFFQVDPNTGNLQFHSAESLGYLKFEGARAKAAAPSALGYLKWDGMKGEQRVSVAGVDAQGHVIQENSRGERFYLGPNGDMVFVK